LKLASEKHGRDGRLLVVSRDLTTAAPATGIAATLQNALDRWDEVEPALQELYAQLNAVDTRGARRFDSFALTAPLPRAWQWLDGSAFATHGELMQRAFGLPALESDVPLMYQGMSHNFLGGAEPVPLPREADGIDFEGEFGVITGDVPMGTRAADAAQYIRLAVQINDWSLRALAVPEMKTGFGWIRAKPACSVAPVAVTLDELGADWHDHRIQATLEIHRNGERFGRVPATHMAFGFDDLIAHAAETRSLCAGTIIGSGTVSSPDYRAVGSCCISERQALEMIDFGEKRTPFLSFGERVRMEAWGGGAAVPLFGTLDQQVAKG
jgi:fumarylacetoacetate (FAA) hydrolase